MQTRKIVNIGYGVMIAGLCTTAGLAIYHKPTDSGYALASIGFTVMGIGMLLRSKKFGKKQK